MNNGMSETLVAVGYMARRLGVNRLTARGYLARGVCPGAFQLPSGQWRVPVVEVEALIPQQAEQTAQVVGAK